MKGDWLDKISDWCIEGFLDKSDMGFKGKWTDKYYFWLFMLIHDWTWCGRDLRCFLSWRYGIN